MKCFDALDVELHGRRLVEASAGTGKTHAISTLFLRLLLDGLESRRILVVTFTEAATAELADRIRRRLRDAVDAFATGATDDRELQQLVDRSRDRNADRRRLAVELQTFDEAAISTIHGFCQRVLHEAAFESGVAFDCELMADVNRLRDDALYDLWAAEVSTRSETFVDALRDAQLKPATCRALADKALRDPTMPVVPELTPSEEPTVQEYFEAVRAARDVWDEGEITETIRQASGLSRSKYRNDHVKKRCEKISEFLRDPPLLPGVPDKSLGARALAARSSGAPPGHPFFDAWQRVVDATEAFESAMKRQVVAFRHRVVDYVRTAVPIRKERAGVLSFDDLLERVRAALLGPSGNKLSATLRRRFPAALIDEFQDTDPIQYAIFEAVYCASTSGTDCDWTTKRALFLIGDPKQAIYSFRGADVFAYMRAAKETPAGQRYTMGTNWRSDPSLVNAVSHLFKRKRWPFILPEIGFPPVTPRDGADDAFRRDAERTTPPLEVLFVRRAKETSSREKRVYPSIVPRLVATEVAHLLRGSATIGGRPITASDIAVLTRTNRQAFEVQEALTAVDVPSVVLGDKTVFEQPEADELQLVLSAAAEPTSTRALRAALTTELLGVTASDLAAMETDETLWDDWVHGFRDWNNTWNERGFIQMFRALMAQTQVRARLLKLPTGERKMTNLLHLMELLHTATTELHLGPTGLLHWLDQQRRDTEGYAADARQIRLESDELAVKLTTVHRAKGLEYNVVFCPYLWASTTVFDSEKSSLQFHDTNDADRLKLSVAYGLPEFDAHLDRATWEAFAENQRLLYVALTRAKHRCTVLWGAFKGFDRSPLGYVLADHALEAEPPTFAEAAAPYTKVSDDTLLSRLHAIADAAPRSFSVREVVVGASVPPARTEQQSKRRMEPRRVQHPIDRWWRTASFSQLASSAEPSAIELSEGRDRDEVATRATGVDRGVGSTPITLLDFPRGAKAGNFFHELFESADFQRIRSAPTRVLIDAKLSAYGYDAALAGLVLEVLDEVVNTPLDGERNLRLADVATTERLDELGFHVPVACGQPGERTRLGQVTQSLLAGVFRDHPSLEVPKSYADRLGRLQFLPVRGYLKGYIDMVFRHGGKYYVVDYKTNHLGDDLSAYARDELPGALVPSHYFLQYHLYSLALHRYLGARLASYDYERDFGGVYYLFIKGMTRSTGPASGVFYEKPPKARIRGLSDLFVDPTAGGPK